MTYAAFLRGVNVNGRKVLKDDLLRCFLNVGFSNVRTVAQTGNVVFDSDPTEATTLQSQIEEALAQQLDMHIFTLIFPIEFIRKAIEDYPFARQADRHAYLVLTDDAAASVLNGWDGSTVDEVAVAPVGIYWSVPKGMTLDSPFAKFLASKTTAPRSTTRNINTLEKITASVA